MLQELYEQYKDTFSKSDHKLIQYLYIVHIIPEASEDTVSSAKRRTASVSHFRRTFCTHRHQSCHGFKILEKNRISEFKRTENKAADPGYRYSQFPPYFCTEAF